MKTAELSSTCLSSATHDPRTNSLELEFCQGRIYRYEGVPEGVFRKLTSAPSQGQYFNQKIRSRYPISERYIRLRATPRSRMK